MLRIGPDALDLQLTVETVQARLMSKRFCGRQLGALLLDQSFIAGPGNYLRVEILWQARLVPQHRPRDLNEEPQRLLCQAILDIPHLSYTTRGQPGAKDHHGAVFRFRAFHRVGKACERCGHAIEKTTFSGRSFFIGARDASNSQQAREECKPASRLASRRAGNVDAPAANVSQQMRGW